MDTNRGRKSENHGFETRSCSHFARHYPRGFTFYLPDPISSVRGSPRTARIARSALQCGDLAPLSIATIHSQLIDLSKNIRHPWFLVIRVYSCEFVVSRNLLDAELRRTDKGNCGKKKNHTHLSHWHALGSDDRGCVYVRVRNSRQQQLLEDGSLQTRRRGVDLRYEKRP
jgi:hypothetical protein